MLLYEIEGKAIFKSYGIPIPRGEKATTPEEAKEAAEKIGSEVVLKAQISSGGRGKAGVVKFAKTPDEAKALAEQLLGKEVKGETVKLLLVEEKINIAKELYLGITLDPELQKPVIIGCAEGGMDIEEVAEKHPEKIVKQPLEVLKPFKIHQANDFMRQLGFHGKQLVQAGKILYGLVRVYFDYDATTVEINPLVITGDNEIVAADSKLVVDDSSSYRHPDLPWERLNENLKPLEKEAKEAGFPFVLLENNGYIGIIGGGAGVGLATMDTIYHHGGIPANFLDTGGGVTRERMAKALEVVLKTPGVKGVIANLFGGINNCAIMAQGIVDVLEKHKVDIPIVVKMRGHHQEEGWKLLEKYNVPLIKYGSTDEAAELLMKLVRERSAGNVSVG
jgi:succinyl-CoA synthetase beta subunit